jgi:hypothetical protein
VDSLGRLKIFLSRTIVFGTWDAWTLIPVTLALAALVAAFGFYFWSLDRRLRTKRGVDWDAELGFGRSPILPANPRQRFASRLWLGGISAFALFTGMGAVLSGHITTRDKGRNYSADGAAARAAGGIFCAAGLLLGFAAVFSDSKTLNRRLGEEEKKP